MHNFIMTSVLDILVRPYLLVNYLEFNLLFFTFNLKVLYFLFCFILFIFVIAQLFRLFRLFRQNIGNNLKHSIDLKDTYTCLTIS